MAQPMPILPVETLCNGLDDSEAQIIRACFRNGRLRAAKPNRKRPCSDFEGRVNYVWRMLCFSYCDWSPHVCMPVTADFDIPTKNYDERRVITKALDDLIKRATSNLPVTLERGTMRWGRAFGMIG